MAVRSESVPRVGIDDNTAVDLVAQIMCMGSCFKRNLPDARSDRKTYIILDISPRTSLATSRDSLIGLVMVTLKDLENFPSLSELMLDLRDRGVVLRVKAASLVILAVPSKCPMQIPVEAHPKFPPSQSIFYNQGCKMHHSELLDICLAPSERRLYDH